MPTPNERHSSGAARPQASFKAASEIEQVIATSRQAAKRPEVAAVKPAPDIAGNPFHKIMFDPAMTMTDKKAAMAKALTFDKSLPQEENEKRIESYTVFSEWMQTMRKNMAIEMLKLNDTEAFAQLKQVIDELGAGIRDFNGKIEPFMTILDSLYKMQLAGVKTSDMLDEIVSDREETERLNRELDGHKSAASAAGTTIRGYQDRVAELQNEKSWYTLGTKIKPSAQAEIDKIALRISDKQGDIARLTAQVKETQTALNTPRTSRFEAMTDVKDNLKMLLDITSDRHRENQAALNTSAAEFVQTSEQKVGSVLENIKTMNDRIEAAGKKSGKMISIYAVMNDAVAGAMTSNHDVLGTVNAPEGEEGLVEKIQREETRESVLAHIKTLTEAKESTIRMYDGLAKEKAELNSMRDSNEQQISATRYLHSSGIANMGMQLNATLTALASAANGQSTKVAQELVDQMGDQAVVIRGKDSLRAALEFQATNETLERTIQIAAQSAEMMRNTAKLTGETLATQQILLAKVKDGAEEMQKAITSTLEVYADNTAAEANDNRPQDGFTSARPAAHKPAKDDFASFKIG